MILIAAIMTPGLLLFLSLSPSDTDQSTVVAKGGISSGWINDVQVLGGSGHDSWPAMVSRGDSIYVALSRFDSGTGLYRITVMESIDGGVVWSEIGDFSPGAFDCKYPVITDYNGVLFVAFQYDLSATDHDIYCYISSAGATGPWTSYGIRTDSNDDYRPAIGSVISANHAGVYVVFENHRGSPDGTDLLLYKSTGGAFSFLGTLAGGGDAGEFTMADISVYQDELNPIIYVAFELLSGGQKDIYFIRSLNGGSTWSSMYQVTSSPNDEYSPSISVGTLFLLTSYVMWNGNPDVYAIVWNGAAFGNPIPLSASADNEGWPEAYNWWDNFYVFYAKGSTATNGQVYLQTASGLLNPTWSYSAMISDPDAAVEVEYRPGLAQCDRPDANFYFATAWGDYRAGIDNSDIYYSTQGCRYTVNTDPAGLSFRVDGVTYTSEQVFSWPAGFQHTMIANDGTSTFLRWDDGLNQYYTQTTSQYALTDDVTLTAYYTAIPEFSHLAIPVLGMMCVLMFTLALRRNRNRVR